MSGAQRRHFFARAHDPCPGRALLSRSAAPRDVGGPPARPQVPKQWPQRGPWDPPSEPFGPILEHTRKRPHCLAAWTWNGHRANDATYRSSEGDLVDLPGPKKSGKFLGRARPIPKRPPGSSGGTTVAKKGCETAPPPHDPPGAAPLRPQRNRHCSRRVGAAWIRTFLSRTHDPCPGRALLSRPVAPTCTRPRSAQQKKKNKVVGKSGPHKKSAGLKEKSTGFPRSAGLKKSVPGNR